MTEKQHSDQATGDVNGDQKQQGGGFASEIGSMLQESQKKGAKGALMSRLRKTQIGKVNLGPEVGKPTPRSNSPAGSRATDANQTRWTRTANHRL